MTVVERPIFLQPDPLGDFAPGVIQEAFTNKWLAAPERNFNEVDTVLEVRLQTMERHFLSGGEDPIAADYGVVERPSPELARFMAYVALLDEYHLVQDFNLNQIATHRRQAAAEKERINGTQMSGGKRRNRIEGVWAEANKSIKPLQIRADEGARIQDLVTRKAVLEFFSVGESNEDSISTLGINQFVKVVSKACEATDTSGTSDAGLRDRRPIDYVVHALALYLDRTKDPEMLSRYQYRRSPDIACTTQDTETLSTMLVFALKPESLPIRPEMQREFERLGTAFFDFLKRRALVGRLPNERYALLALTHDVYLTAFLVGRIDYINGVSKLLDSDFSSLRYGPSVRVEIERCMREYEELFGAAFSGADKYTTETATGDLRNPLLRLDFHDPHFTDRLPITSADFIVSTEYRLFWSFGMILALRERHGIKSLFDPSELSKSIPTMMWKFRKERGSVELNFEDFLRQVFLRSDLLSRKGIEVCLSSILHDQDLHDVDTATNSQVQRRIHDDHLGPAARNASSPQEAIRRLSAHFPSTETPGFDRNMLGHYLLLFWEEGRTLPEIERENEWLWGEVLDQYMWFVSPRGDRYSRRHNSELVEKAIDSLRFDVDTNHPREHRAVVRLEGVDRPLVFWLDTHRYLLGSQRQILTADIVLKQRFTNFLLRRLYFIKSGILSSPPSGRGNEEGRPHFIEYKRAHYRILVSTERREITMTSQSARLHAQEVFEDYGIDIFEEIRRRRNLGRLEEDQFLTFVREFVRSYDPTQLIEPNEIKYDERLLNIPQVSQRA